MSCELPYGSKTFVEETEMEFVEVEAKEFPASVEMDVCYNTFLFASDDRLYMGTCCQSGSAHLLAYDPKQDKILDLANMDEVIPDLSRGYAGHGKIHTPLFEGTDGKIYGATHMDILFPFWSSFYDSHGYAGGHWFCYEPKSGKCSDLGLAIPKEGILTMAMDKQRQILYGVSWPRGYLLAYDIRKGVTENKGRASIHLSRYIICMSDGTVFLTGRNGHIATYRPGQQFVEDLPVRLNRRMGELYTADIGKDTTFTAPVEWEPAKSFLAFVFRTGDVFKYDQIEKKVEYYELFNEGFYCNVQPVVASDKKVYYAIAAEGKTSVPNQSGRIFRFDPVTKVNELVGYMRCGNLNQFFHLSGGAIGPDDTIYWFALTHRNLEEDDIRTKPSCDFYMTKPVLIKYNPKNRNL